MLTAHPLGCNNGMFSVKDPGKSLYLNIYIESTFIIYNMLFWLDYLIESPDKDWGRWIHRISWQYHKNMLKGRQKD